MNILHILPSMYILYANYNFLNLNTQFVNRSTISMYYVNNYKFEFTMIKCVFKV